MEHKYLHKLTKKTTGRLARWSFELLEFDYEVIYRKNSVENWKNQYIKSFPIRGFILIYKKNTCCL